MAPCMPESVAAQCSQNRNEEGGGGGIAGLPSIDQQAELCSTALLMPAQSTGIAF